MNCDNMNRTIRIRGNAVVTAPADITVVRAKVSGLAEDYATALKALADVTKSLRDAVEKAGIPRNDLKTVNVSVKQHFKDVSTGKDKNGNTKYRRVADGFQYSQGVVFEFPNDNSKLSSAIWNISKCDIEPEIDFHYRNSDSNANKNRALAEAARNARTEAETILGALGARLGRIIEVDRQSRLYDDYDGHRMILGDCNMSVAPDFEFEPEDEEFSESVTIEWEIED